MLHLALAASAGVYNVSIGTEGPDGSFTIEVHEEWAPLASARFRELVQEGFYDGSKFFRAVHNFMVQFGIAAVPGRRHTLLQDEPAALSNTRGTVSFATSGPNARATQIFVNTNDNSYLDAMGFAPFGRVVEGLDVVERLYAGYGEAPMAHNAEMHEHGNAYLQAAFPLLSTLRRATLQPAPELQRLLARGPEDFAAGALTFAREQKRTSQEREDFLGRALAFAREQWPVQAADAAAGAAVRTAVAAAVPAAVPVAVPVGAAAMTAAAMPSKPAAIEAAERPEMPSATLVDARAAAAAEAHATARAAARTMLPPTGDTAVTNVAAEPNATVRAEASPESGYLAARASAAASARAAAREAETAARAVAAPAVEQPRSALQRLVLAAAWEKEQMPTQLQQPRQPQPQTQPEPQPEPQTQTQMQTQPPQTPQTRQTPRTPQTPQPNPATHLATELLSYVPQSGQQQVPPRPRYAWTREGIAMWAKVNGPTYARAGAPRAGSVVTEPVLWGWAAAGIPAEDLEASKWIAPIRDS